MDLQERHVDERLSLKGQLCTVRYIGPVADKPGSWLGVEWDDANRGKHNGTHEGVSYFTCISKSLTCASFLRPAQSWDEPRSFLQALREKYMPEFHENDAEFVYFSGKQAEEVGFEKFSRRQAKLQGIHVLVLDHMCIRHRDDDEIEKKAISDICSEIAELDLSGNLFESLDEIVTLCALFPRLRVLTLDGNRFSVNRPVTSQVLRTVRSLSLSRTLLHYIEVELLLSSFPCLETLTVAHNEIDGAWNLSMPSTVTTLNLSDNRLTALTDLEELSMQHPNLQTVILKRNNIKAVTIDKHPFWFPFVELDLTYNQIPHWSFFTSITPFSFPNLKHLRITGNPLYENLVSAEGKPLSTEDGYMLTLARLPELEYLNYAKITPKERLNAETYYLSQIAHELANAPPSEEDEILEQHPQYRKLCEEYGEPTVLRNKLVADDINPNTLAANLLRITFHLAPNVCPHVESRSWTQEWPKSWSTYSLLGSVGKRLAISPIDMRLVLETNERDPLGKHERVEPEWWDSSDEEEHQAVNTDWTLREVKMVAGTRAVGTYVDGREARVRVDGKIGH